MRQGVIDYGDIPTQVKEWTLTSTAVPQRLLRGNPRRLMLYISNTDSAVWHLSLTDAPLMQGVGIRFTQTHPPLLWAVSQFGDALRGELWGLSSAFAQLYVLELSAL